MEEPSLALCLDLCLAMRSDPLGMIRGLEEVMTCIYGPAVTYAFPDPFVTAYRDSVAQRDDARERQVAVPDTKARE